MSEDKRAERDRPHECAIYKPLESKRIIFGISGGIAAFKAAEFARALYREGAEIVPVLTKNGARFITPLTLSALTGSRCLTGMFQEEEQEKIPHISYAKRADIFLVLPATADMLARAACGMADDLLTTMLLAFRGPVLFFPSMNPAMYEHPATQANIQRLKSLGYTVVEPGLGSVACGDFGPGRLPDYDTVHFHIRRAVTRQGLEGKKVMVTAGPTREPIDPVRFISNRSSGKMGYAVAKEAALRGAEVTLITGPVSIKPPPGTKVIRVESAAEMAQAVLSGAEGMDVIVMTAAVADYTPEERAESKIKKGPHQELTIRLKRTVDILSELGSGKRPGQILVGFCAETEELVENARKKLFSKGLDLIVGNNILEEGAGFDVDTNRVIILDREENLVELPLLPKEEIAEAIWHRIEELLAG